jgi:hypothetical protein
MANSWRPAIAAREEMEGTQIRGIEKEEADLT